MEKQAVAQYLEYQTLLSPTLCVERLKMKNIYDTFEYKFEDDGTGNYKIIFTKSLAHTCRGIRTCYSICFSPIALRGTRVTLNFISELFILPVPCISEKWIDEFFIQKLECSKV